MKNSNDIAYYLEKAEIYDEAIFILENIIKKEPTRVVAYLNIADAYWGTENKSQAKKNYEKYLYLMKSQKKDLSKIPQRVYERIR
jgi:tetratricopeptide (TPR) repeat protein